MAHDPYNCASFSFKGLATDPSVYPGPWKAAMFFLSFCKYFAHKLRNLQMLTKGVHLIGPENNKHCLLIQRKFVENLLI